MNKSSVKQTTSNLIIQRIQIDSFKSHIQNMEHVKPCIRRQSPFRHTFSLSKFQNRYEKFIQSQKCNANEKLLQRMINIQSRQSRLLQKTNNHLYPRYKSLFDNNRTKQRTKMLRNIQKQNQRIGFKLQSISSHYNHRVLNDKQKRNQFQRNLILDYKQVAKRQLKIIRI